MTSARSLAAALVEQVSVAPRAGRRRVVALAGAPASGKSTLAAALAEALSDAGHPACVVPMDGFHLDNAILSARGILARKGAPESFDVAGLLRLVRALPAAETVIYPVFDRARDIAIAGAGEVTEGCDTVIVEGNYLLFDAPGWRDLARSWDFSIRLQVPLPVLRTRLIERWLGHGLSHAEAIARAEENDLPNARRVAAAGLPADLTLGD